MQLLQTNWYRRDGTVEQPGRRRCCASTSRCGPATSPRTSPPRSSRTSGTPPSFTAARGGAAAAPSSRRRWRRSPPRWRRCSRSPPRRGAVPLRLATSWDNGAYAPSADLVVLETTAPVPARELGAASIVGPRVPSPAGPATPAPCRSTRSRSSRRSSSTASTAAPQCDGDDRNPIVQPRRRHASTDFAAALRGDRRHGRAAQPVRKPPTPRRAARLRARGSPLRHARGRRLRRAAARPHVRRVGCRPRSVPTTARRSATRGSAWSRTGTRRRSPASATATACGRRTRRPAAAVLRAQPPHVTPVGVGSTPPQLMPTLLRAARQRLRPAAAGRRHRAGASTVTPDRIQSHGLEHRAGALRPAAPAWSGRRCAKATCSPRTRRADGGDARTRASIVQVTNLGITVKDSPQNTLVFVTRLDTGAPVAGARGVDRARSTTASFWRGTTGADGVAVAPQTPLRDPERLVTSSRSSSPPRRTATSPTSAATGTKASCRGSSAPTSTCTNASRCCAARVFTDRGVYRLGEDGALQGDPAAEHARRRAAAARGHAGAASACATGRTARRRADRAADRVEQRRVDAHAAGRGRARRLLGARDSRGRSAEAAHARAAARPASSRVPRTTTYVRYERTVHGSFLVAAYRRPDFRVDVTLTGAGAARRRAAERRRDRPLPVRRADGRAPVTWTLRASRRATARRRRSPSGSATTAGCSSAASPAGRVPRTRRAARATRRRSRATGDLPLSLETEREAGIPYVYPLEGDVEDVSRQHIANRASVTRAPGAVVRRRAAAAYFLEQKAGLADRGRRRRPRRRGRRRRAGGRHAARRCSGRACAAPRATASTPGTPQRREVAGAARGR